MPVLEFFDVVSVGLLAIRILSPLAEASCSSSPTGLGKQPLHEDTVVLLPSDSLAPSP